MTATTVEHVKTVTEECKNIVGNCSIPSAIADALTLPDADGKSLLFSDHPMSLATLPLVTYLACGGSNPKDVAGAGAAMEFLLTAGDVLDDLQDRDIRFTGPDAHDGYTRTTELITALLLLSEHAIGTINPDQISPDRILRSIRTFARFKQQAFAGQYADAHAQDSTYTKPKQILERTQKKSGSLGKCAAEIGAILATDDQNTIDLAAEFGEHLGIVYQLKNDIFDLWPGHGMLSDATSGKATAPTAFSLAVGDSEAGSSAVSRVLENLRPRADDVELAREETFDSGGMHFAMIQSFAHLARSRTIAKQISARTNSEHVEKLLANL